MTIKTNPYCYTLRSSHRMASHCRITTLIGCMAMVLGTYVASYSTRLLPFMFWYSLVSGLGVGLGYSTPMIAGWSWFPESKGLINGLTLFGFGFGAFIFNKIGTGLAQSGVAWGPMIRKISYMYAAISFAGSLLIKAKPPLEECEVVDVSTNVVEDDCEPPSASFKQAITSRRFALLWSIGLMAFTPGLTLLGIYKRFGMSNPAALIANDSLLSTIGGEAERGAKRRASRDISSDENRACSYFRTRRSSSIITAIILVSHSNPFRDSLRSSQVWEQSPLALEGFSGVASSTGLASRKDTTPKRSSSFFSWCSCHCP